MVALAGAVVIACSASGSESAADPNSRLREILVEQNARYPSMREKDLYKLLYQAARGPAHAADQEMARTWMDRELTMLSARRALTPLAGEPMLDEIDPRGLLVRVNLRPFLAAGGDAFALADAFARTASEFTEDPATLEEDLAAAAAILREGGLGVRVNPVAFDNFVADRRATQFPAVHHSPEYESAHIPAYRVVLRRLAPPLGSR